MTYRKTAFFTGALMLATAGMASAQTTLKIGLAEDPDVLDPTLARTFVGRIVFASLCDKLLDISPDLKVVPQLATSYKWTDDNKGLVLTIRDGVTFQDGEPLNAEVVKYSLNRHLTMQGSTRKGEIASIQSIDVTDDHTVKLTLSAPFSPLIAALSDRAGMIVSPKAAEALKDKFGTAPVCAGPYKFVERVAQDRIVVEKFDKYWNKDKIKIDKIVFQPIPDNSVRIANLRSGGLDFIERVAPTDLAQVKGDANLSTASIAEIGYQGITVNVANGPKSKNPLGQDPRIRQALAHAMDRKMIVDKLWLGRTKVPPGLQFDFYGDMLVPGWAAPEYDLAKARALVKEAGYKGDPIPYRVLNDYYTLQTANAQVLTEMWQQAGLNVQIEMKENWAQIWDPKAKRAIHDWSNSAQFSDPVSSLPTQHGPQGQQQQVHEWANDEMNKLCGVLQTSTDKAERKKAYQRMLVICEREDPAYTVINQNATFTAKQKATKWTAAPDFAMDFRATNWGGKAG